MGDREKHTYPVRIELDDLFRSVDLGRETVDEARARILSIAETRLETELMRIEAHDQAGGTIDNYLLTEE